MAPDSLQWEVKKRYLHKHTPMLKSPVKYRHSDIIFERQTCCITVQRLIDCLCDPVGLPWL